MGIASLERNKLSKTKTLFMKYMMVMQFFFTTAGLALFGYWIGKKINPDTNLYIILTGIGLGLGVMIGFVTLIKMIQSEERYERNVRH